MSGLVSVVIFMIIRRGILHTEHPLLNGYKALPLFYGVTVLVNVFSIVHDGPKCKYLAFHLDKLIYFNFGLYVCTNMCFIFSSTLYGPYSNVGSTSMRPWSWFHSCISSMVVTCSSWLP